jgi:REP element-mobilizing transposase RayT
MLRVLVPPRRDGLDARARNKSDSNRNRRARHSSMKWMKRTGQRSFEFTAWGGARKGAGRKLSGLRRSMPHRKRVVVKARHPVHVTLRVEPGLESLRRRQTYAVVREALAAGANRHGLRLVHYSVMTNHVHLVCETDDERALGRGITGVCVRMARALNRRWGRYGRVFGERYHAHVLKTPREVRNALAYVLQNAAHHKIHVEGIDPCSSGAWFDGWHEWKREARDFLTCPLPSARTWLLAQGWRRHGLIPHLAGE